MIEAAYRTKLVSSLTPEDVGQTFLVLYDGMVHGAKWLGVVGDDPRWELVPGPGVVITSPTYLEPIDRNVCRLPPRPPKPETAHVLGLELEAFGFSLPLSPLNREQLKAWGEAVTRACRAEGILPEGVSLVFEREPEQPVAAVLDRPLFSSRQRAEELAARWEAAAAERERHADVNPYSVGTCAAYRTCARELRAAFKGGGS